MFTYHDGLSHTVSICGIAFLGASSFPLSFLSCLVCTRYRSTIRAPSVIWGAVGGVYRMCVVSFVESVQFSYRSNKNNLTHLHARVKRRNNVSTGSNGTREEWRPDVTAWARCGSTHSWIYIVEIAPGAISPMRVRKYN